MTRASLALHSKVTQTWKPYAPEKPGHWSPDVGHCGALSITRLASQPAPAPQQPLPLSFPGVILPGETKHFTFFFKSLNAGIFRESWEFGTHPTLLGGAVLQVTLHAISLTQDIFMDERKLLEVRDSEPSTRVPLRRMMCALEWMESLILKR